MLIEFRKKKHKFIELYIGSEQWIDGLGRHTIILNRKAIKSQSQNFNMSSM